MSVLWARATDTRTAFDLSAAHPAEARSLLTSVSTRASSLVSPLVLVGVLGAGFGVVLGVVLAGRRWVGRGLVGSGAGVRRTARGVVPVACWLVRREALGGALVPVVEGVLVLATGAAAGVVLAVGSAPAGPCTAARPEAQPASRTPPASVASNARAALGAPIGVIPVLSR